MRHLPSLCHWRPKILPITPGFYDPREVLPVSDGTSYLFSTEGVQVMDVSDTKMVNISEQAKKTGIEVPVMLEASLEKNLRPSPYLSSLGITLERRIENLLNLVNGNLHMRDKEGTPAENRFYIPFMILKGPLVCEDFLPVIVSVSPDNTGQPLVTITQAIDTDTGCM
jgi:hypothetical protein